MHMVTGSTNWLLKLRSFKQKFGRVNMSIEALRTYFESLIAEELLFLDFHGDFAT